MRAVYRRQARYFRRAYAEGVHGWPVSGATPEVRRYLKRISRSGPRRGLDLGCGEGRHAILMAQLGFRVEGVDLEPLALRKAGACAAAARVRKRIRFSRQDALKLRFGKETFDVVVDSGCFHHMVKPDWPAYVREIHRVLRPGGHLILTVFSMKFRHYPGEKRTRPWLYHRNHYDRFFGKRDLAPIFAPDLVRRDILEEHKGLNGFWHCLFQKSPDHGS